MEATTTTTEYQPLWSITVRRPVNIGGYWKEIAETWSLRAATEKEAAAALLRAMEERGRC